MSNIMIEASEFYRAGESLQNPTIVERLINGRPVTEIRKPVLSEKWQAVIVIIASIAALSLGVFGTLGLASVPTFVSIFGALPPVWGLWLGAIGGGVLGLGTMIFGAYNYYRITQFNSPRVLTQADQQFLTNNLKLTEQSGDARQLRDYQFSCTQTLDADSQSILIKVSKEILTSIKTLKVSEINRLDNILRIKLDYT